MRMYHPDLGVEAPFPDDPDCVAVQEEAGWVVAPEEKAPSPAHAPEPTKYAPVDPEGEGGGKGAGSKTTSAKSAKSS